MVKPLATHSELWKGGADELGKRIRVGDGKVGMLESVHGGSLVRE